MAGYLAQHLDEGSPRAPASPLTSVSIYAVGSSNCDWVYQPPNSPTCKHGDPELRVAILERGYSSNRIAWVNAGLLPVSANYDSVGICTVNGVETMPCPRGYSITSWMRYYNLDSYASWLPNVYFQYQATSTNPPNNTYSTSITIR